MSDSKLLNESRLVERLNQHIKQESAILMQVWSEIGFNQSEIDQKLMDLERRLFNVIEDTLSVEKDTKKQLEQKLADALARIATLTATLQMNSVEVALNDEVAAMSLREKIELVFKDVNALDERLKKNQRHLEQLHMDLQYLCRVLRIHEAPNEVRFQLQHFREIGQYMSSERISQYREAIQEAQSLKSRRDSVINGLREQILSLFLILEVPATSGLDAQIKESGLDSSTHTINLLQQRLNELQQVRNSKKKELDEVLEELQRVWFKLHVEEPKINDFLEIRNQGLGPTVFDACYAELEARQVEFRDRLQELVEGCRATLRQLWENLHVDDATAASFAAFSSTEYSEEVLALHEQECARYMAKWKMCKPLLDLIRTRESLLAEKKKLDILASDSSRLMSKNHKIAAEVREEGKRRVLIETKLTKLNAKLKADLTTWRDSQGEAFMFDGSDYLERLAASVSESSRSSRSGAGGAAKRVAAAAATPSSANSAQSDYQTPYKAVSNSSQHKENPGIRRRAQ